MRPSRLKQGGLIVFSLHAGYTIYIRNERGSTMNAIISKWGNSRGVRIPKPYLEDLGLKENDIVDIEIKGNAIMIKKSPMRKRKTIEERFEMFYDTDFETALSNNAYDFELIDWGKPEGDEAW